jgi:DNA-directed RNA polymerase specialized sigma24 family protein
VGLQCEIPLPYRNRPLIEQGLALLAQAQQAAARGEAQGMIEALAASGYLDGLVGRLTAQWGNQIGQAELRDIVAETVDKAFDAIAQGKTVTNLGGWLLKVAENAARDRWNEHHKGRVDGAELDGNYRRPAPITDSERSLIDGHADRCRDEAVAIARRLLPKVGEGQIREVMALVIDAVEHGVPDLPAAQIAATLGLGDDSVRTLLSRGFRRLRRAATDEGIAWPDDLELEELDEIEALHKHVREQEDNLDAE